MKALACGRCGDIQGLQNEWRSCKCGLVRARWTDAQRGLAEFDVPDPGYRQFAFLLGLHNGVLVPALRGKLVMFQDFRERAEKATDAPGYVFDKSRAGSWAVVVRAGVTSDVSWHEPDESELPPSPSDGPSHG